MGVVKAIWPRTVVVVVSISSGGVVLFVVVSDVVVIASVVVVAFVVVISFGVADSFVFDVVVGSSVVAIVILWSRCVPVVAAKVVLVGSFS